MGVLDMSDGVSGSCRDEGRGELTGRFWKCQTPASPQRLMGRKERRNGPFLEEDKSIFLPLELRPVRGLTSLLNVSSHHFSVHLDSSKTVCVFLPDFKIKRLQRTPNFNILVPFIRLRYLSLSFGDAADQISETVQASRGDSEVVDEKIRTETQNPSSQPGRRASRRRSCAAG